MSRGSGNGQALVIFYGLLIIGEKNQNSEPVSCRGNRVRKARNGRKQHQKSGLLSLSLQSLQKSWLRKRDNKYNETRKTPAGIILIRKRHFCGCAMSNPEKAVAQSQFIEQPE